MKPKLITFFFFLSLFNAASGQDCSAFFPFKEGTVREYTIYDKKAKPEGVITHEIIKLSAISDGGILADVSSRMVNKKGKEAYSGTFSVECKDDVFYSDASNLMPAEMLESLGSMEVTIEGTELLLPGNLEVGQTLPDANTTVKASNSGFAIMNWSIVVTNRKVAAREKISTPAGEFDCFKITYDTALKSIIGKSYSGADWVAKNVGVVRTESYDKNGSLESYMELSRLTKE